MPAPIPPPESCAFDVATIALVAVPGIDGLAAAPRRCGGATPEVRPARLEGREFERPDTSSFEPGLAAPRRPRRDRFDPVGHYA